MSASRSPTPALLVGLLVTLAAVVVDAWYVTRQIRGLRALQTELTDRNRRDSLQLLRIQNDINSLGLTMRDMLDSEEPYPLTAWAAQFDRIRGDLDDALRREAQVAVSRRTPEQSEYLARSLKQFWDAADRIFDLARAGQEQEARTQIRLSLQARQAALGTAVARLLVENTESEEQTGRRVQEIYVTVERQVYWFLAATLLAILLTGLYLIRANRRLFGTLRSLSDERQELAQELIAARESTLREIARELHDEFGQLLTAIGSMLGRARRLAPAGSPIGGELDEVRGIAQTALDSVRGLSQSLHPSILDEIGLDATLDWYLPIVQRQSGVAVSYERSGTPVPIDSTIAIHVYRVLQEALTNVTKHSGAATAAVRLHFEPGCLQLEVEDRGRGFSDGGASRRGLGIVTMRERAALVKGTLDFLAPEGGGTMVRLRVPLAASRADVA